MPPPTVSISAIEGGHRITITDKDGENTFDVMDGVSGEDGRGIVSVTRTSRNGGLDNAINYISK